MDENEKTLKVTGFKIIPTKDIKSERIYANYFSVSHGPYDFTLTFCDGRPPVSDKEMDEIESGKVLVFPIQVEVAIPAQLVGEVIKALNRNYEAYKRNYLKGKE